MPSVLCACRLALAAVALVVLAAAPGAPRVSAASVLAAPTTREVAADGACSTCQAVVRVLDDFMCDEEVTVQAVEFVEHQVCPMLGVDPDTCGQLAVQLVPLAIDWLRSEATPAQLCASVGVCGTQGWELPAESNPVLSRHLKDGLECPMCRQVVSLLQHSAQSPADVILATAAQACDGLPVQMSAWCQQWVQERASLLPAVVAAQPGVEVTCTVLGSCKSGLAGAAPTPLPPTMVEVLAALHRLYTQWKTVLSQQSAARHLLDTSNVNSNACDVCKLSVLELHTLVSNPQVQDDVTTYLKGMCAMLGSPASGQCSTYVDLTMPLVYSSIQQELQDTTAICKALHVCTPMAPPTAAMVVSRLQLPWRNGDGLSRRMRALRH